MRALHLCLMIAVGILGLYAALLLRVPEPNVSLSRADFVAEDFKRFSLFLAPVVGVPDIPSQRQLALFPGGRPRASNTEGILENVGSVRPDIEHFSGHAEANVACGKGPPT